MFPGMPVVCGGTVHGGHRRDQRGFSAVSRPIGRGRSHLLSKCSFALGYADIRQCKLGRNVGFGH